MGDALRAELSIDKIKVNIICPGYIKTPLTEKNNFPMPFLITAEKAAQYIKKGLTQNRPLIIFPKKLYFAMQLINFLPVKLADYILLKLPKK